MTKLCISLVVLFSLTPCFSQSWSGQSSSDARVVPPYKLCVGLDNGQDACFIQSGSLIARLNGQLDFALVAKTVATLPPAALNSGRIYRVTDGVTNGDCTVGGGATLAVCLSSGSVWTSIGAGSASCVGGTCLLTPGLAGIVVSNGVNGNTTIAGTGDINGALGYTAANDTLVVHTTGIETVAGAKTFVDNATFNGNLSVQGTLNIGTSGPFLLQGVKQAGTPTVGASYDYGAYLDSASIFRCQLLSGSSCGLGITPIYLNSGTPASQTNECASVTNDSSGSTTVTAVAALRTVISGVGHDVLCIVTVDAANPTYVGSIVAPGAVAFSPNSATSQGGAGVIESLRTGGGIVVLTNNGGSNRTNSINMRACNGPGATNCGTDLQIIEDSTGTGKEEWEFLPGGSANPLYIGGLGSTQPGICLGGNVARTNSPFCLDGPSFGHLGHIIRRAADADMWGTLTLSGGTVSYSFADAYTSAPLCIATWQSGTLTGFVKCATTTTGITITSSIGTDNAVIAYMILGNNK